MAIKKVSLQKRRETKNSIALRQMLSLNVGDSFIIESETNQITAYASKHKFKVTTKKLILTDPKDLSQRTVYEVTIVARPQDEKEPAYWERFLSELPKNVKTESIRTLVKQYYEEAV